MRGCSGQLTIDGTGEEEEKTEEKTEEQADTAPDAPGNLALTVGDETVSLSWDEVDGATSYKVYRSSSSGEFDEELTETTENEYTDSTVSACSSSYYVVTAVNDTGESDNSDEASGTPTLTPSGELDTTFSSDGFVTQNSVAGGG